MLRKSYTFFLTVLFCAAALMGGISDSSAKKLSTCPSVEPVQRSFGFSGQYSGTPEFELDSFTVPAGKRLVIETATVTVRDDGTTFGEPLNTGVILLIETTVNDELVQHSLPLKQIYYETQTRQAGFAVVQNLRIYSDPGSSVKAIIKFFTPTTDGNFGLNGTISGSLSGHLTEH